MAADDLQRRLDITQRLDRLNRERQVQANRALTYPAYYAGNDGGTSLARMSDGRVEATGKSISNGMLLPNQPLRMAGGKGLQSRPDTVPLVKLDQPVVKVTEELKIKYLYSILSRKDGKDTISFYVGGWKKKSVLALSMPYPDLGFLNGGILLDNLGGDKWVLTVGYISEPNKLILKSVYSDKKVYTYNPGFEEFYPVRIAPCGSGFWVNNNQNVYINPETNNIAVWLKALIKKFPLRVLSSGNDNGQGFGYFLYVALPTTTSGEPLIVTSASSDVGGYTRNLYRTYRVSNTLKTGIGNLEYALTDQGGLFGLQQQFYPVWYSSQGAVVYGNTFEFGNYYLDVQESRFTGILKTDLPWRSSQASQKQAKITVHSFSTGFSEKSKKSYLVYPPEIKPDPSLFGAYTFYNASFHN